MLQLKLPYVYGNALPPQFYDQGPASIHYVDSKTGEEFMSVDGEFGIFVSATQNSFVTGTFYGTLYPVDEGGATRQVFGDFLYDGKFDLDTSGGNTPTDLPMGAEAPPIQVQILSVKGATGPIGNFVPGDRVEVDFRLAKDDGSAWRLSEMSLGRSMISGPTSNYQRVITQQSDVRQVSMDNGDGSYTYRFPPLPDVYQPPYNDTDSFGPDDGELTGQPLLDGTYTLAMWFEWTYTVAAESYDEVGTKTLNFLIGSEPQSLESREVVTTANCDQCHSELQFHGGQRRTNDMCVLCHTAGAEDRNIPDVAGGTPGATIEMSVMVHKIHNGAHLPSVLGVTTDENGDRVYDAEKKPYQLVGFGNSIHDYGHLEFPAWPNLVTPMPRDTGYADLDSEFQDLEDTMRSGVTNCTLCHGDPDGDEGPLEAPEQGDFAYDVMRRNTCGSCHDDWVFDQPYTANQQTMPAQSGDNNCNFCHLNTNDNLDPRLSHIHPLLDEDFATGVRFDVLNVSVDEDVDKNGVIDPGDKIAVEFTIQDLAGAAIDPADLNRFNLVMSGPSNNFNILVPEMAIPAEVLTEPQPYTMNVPMRVYYEELGVATDGDDVFTSAFIPHWNAGSQDTVVFEHTGFAEGASTLAAAVMAPVNYIDVADATGFERDDFVVIDFGTEDAEWLQIQTVQDNRLWFSSPYTQNYAPGPQKDHAMGMAVQEADLVELTEDMEYGLDTETGEIAESEGAWGTDNTIIVTYTSDYVVPETYPLALNAGPDLGEREGGWAGKSIVPGTYSIGMWGQIDRTLDLFMESQSYRDGAPGERHEFLIGQMGPLDPWDNISSASNCYSCHVDIQFHGNNRRGFDSCLMCHGTAASGDRPQYVAPNAPATDGVTINFREMLHKIHRGADLANAESYTVVGFGQGYPNNFSEHTYEEVHFPAMPDGVLDCAQCHGDFSTAWTQPEDRAHPTEQEVPVQEWTTVCNSCHDSSAEQAHIESQTSPTSGAESCSTCHGSGKIWDVERMHVVR